MILYNGNDSQDLLALISSKIGIDALNPNIVGSLLFAYIDDDVYYFDIISIINNKKAYHSGYFCLGNIEFTNYTVNVDKINQLNDVVTGTILYDPYGILNKGKKLIKARQKVPYGSNQLVFSKEFKSSLRKMIKEKTFEGPMTDQRNLKNFLLHTAFYQTLLKKGIAETQLLKNTNRKFLSSDAEYNMYALAYACYKHTNDFSYNDNIKLYQKKMK